ncbi:hypothetical protein FGG08_006174 [Glutinoglossum americanum]|uniref:AB hydrolase-1 domain-containing protein n=1 Tax=Glutinoglossum americanum TaxID=1670608 RepID=A0A9P8HWW7_9PEZI|nr:hypothetical protein FGG08_006174 [Glutinoglossum americanum]
MSKIHGWPDLSIGWRYQINTLLDLDLRVVVPDMMGYGGTDAPKVPPETLALYGMKRAADDIRELANQLGVHKIILGGHDWGGAIVYRVCLYYPEFVTHLITVTTPYLPLAKEYIPMEKLVNERIPSFRYQLQLVGPDVEAKIQTRDQIKEFLNAVYGGKGPNGEIGFTATDGVLFQNLSVLRPTPLVSAKELDYYADEFARHGLHGPRKAALPLTSVANTQANKHAVNWYRAMHQNFDDEKEWYVHANCEKLGQNKLYSRLDSLTSSMINIPVLFIRATKDMALVESLSMGMEKYIPNLTRRVVKSSHWALWQAPGQVNEYIKEWLDTVYFGASSKI